MLTNCLAACTHIYLQQFPSYLNRKCKKIAIFTYRSPHFCFPWRRPCDYHAIQYVAWMERQFNACQTTRSMYLSIFNSFRVIRCLSQCVSPKIAIFTYRSPHFCFPWRRPCDYHATRCMDDKTTQCLPNPSLHVIHVSIYFQRFPSYLNRKCQNLPLNIPQPTFLFPLETPLRLSSNVLHGWKDNSMLAKPLAARTYLYSIVSQLYDA